MWKPRTKGVIVVDNINYHVKCKLCRNPSNDIIKFLDGYDPTTKKVNMEMHGKKYFVNFAKECDNRYKVNIQGSNEEYICMVPDGWSNYIISAELGKRSRTIRRKEKCPCGSGKKYKYCCLTSDRH